MNNKNKEIEQLEEEIRWTKEALNIVDNCATSHEIQELYKEQIPIKFRHLAELHDSESLEKHLERLKIDLKNLQEGAWE